MFLRFNFFIILIFIKLLCLGFNSSRFLKFLIFSEFVLVNLIFLIFIESTQFEVSLGTSLLVIGACETSVGFCVLVSLLRRFKKEVFRGSKLLLCEGF